MSFYIYYNRGFIVRRSERSGKLQQPKETLMPDTFYIHIRLEQKDGWCELQIGVSFCSKFLSISPLQIKKWSAKFCISRIFLMITSMQINPCNLKINLGMFGYTSWERFLAPLENLRYISKYVIPQNLLKWWLRLSWNLYKISFISCHVVVFCIHINYYKGHK